jgi:heat shock protein HslJ
MKKILFALPLCVFLANCSSSKKATTPPAGPGISNVNVAANGSAPTPVNSSATTSTNRDWAYKSKSDTTLNGTWVLQGMMGANGSWTSAMNDTATANTSAQSPGTDTAGTAGSGLMGTDSLAATGTNSATTGSAGARTKAKAKTNNRAVYDSAKARLSIDPKSPSSTIDSSLLQPYKYWGRTPSMTINSTNRVFSGSTGCNSMSGSFNFSGSDIQFGRRINTSRMNCNDYDEAGFLEAIKKVDTYALTGDQLEFKQGNTVLLTFKRRI